VAEHSIRVTGISALLMNTYMITRINVKITSMLNAYLKATAP
jgi:hypothetical protein